MLKYSGICKTQSLEEAYELVQNRKNIIVGGNVMVEDDE